MRVLISENHNRGVGGFVFGAVLQVRINIQPSGRLSGPAAPVRPAFFRGNLRLRLSRRSGGDREALQLRQGVIFEARTGLREAIILLGTPPSDSAIFSSLQSHSMF